MYYIVNTNTRLIIIPSAIQHVAETLQSNRRQRLLLIIVPCFVPLILHWKSWRERFLAFIGGAFTFFAIASGNNYTHYYTLAIPLVLLCEISTVDFLCNAIDKRAIIATALTFVMLLSQFSIMQDYLYRAYLHLFSRTDLTRNNWYRIFLHEYLRRTINLFSAIISTRAGTHMQICFRV